jgi:hypothetical protein
LVLPTRELEQWFGSQDSVAPESPRAVTDVVDYVNLRSRVAKLWDEANLRPMMQQPAKLARILPDYEP